MLSWCSYCQQFQGERPPFEDLMITHGICGACEPKALFFPERDYSYMKTLQNIQSQLREAGLHADLKAAEQIIEDNAKAKVRPVDILVGLVAPMLYEIGEDWKRGAITVAEEHRFSTFCEHLCELVDAKVKVPVSAGVMNTDRAEIMIVNAPGNRHTLGIRFVKLWLENKGIRVRLIHPCSSNEDLIALVTETRPEKLLVSIALAEQRPAVVTIAEGIAALPGPIRPQIIVGGNAVKLGLVSGIPDADCVADINAI